jgi:hypothetical protein
VTTDRGSERACRLAREHKSIGEAQRFAELTLSYCDPACREATSMAVGELAENLVKYSAGHAGTNAGTIAIQIQGDHVKIRAENNVLSHDDAQVVLETVAKIASSSNVSELYRERLLELFKNPALPRAQLGLLRVAFEGGFRLSCKYAAPSLEISAERRCGASQ